MNMTQVFCIPMESFLPTLCKTLYAHMKREWMKIKTILLLNVNIEPTHWKLNAPHILRVLLILVRIIDDYNHSFANHVRGLTLCLFLKSLGIIRDSTY